MLVYIIPGIVFLVVLIYIILEKALYKEPKDQGYFSNVESVDFFKSKMIAADPKYVLILSIFTGILIGIITGMVSLIVARSYLVTLSTIVILIAYMKEITRTIHIEEGKLILSDFLMKRKEFTPNQIVGMYIYSYNKKFLKHNAYTTKLVITERSGKRTKFILSSLDVKAVQNMMKDNFGIRNYKIFIQKREKVTEIKY